MGIDQGFFGYNQFVDEGSNGNLGGRCRGGSGDRGFSLRTKIGGVIFDSKKTSFIGGIESQFYPQGVYICSSGHTYLFFVIPDPDNDRRTIRCFYLLRFTLKNFDTGIID